MDNNPRALPRAIPPRMTALCQHGRLDPTQRRHQHPSMRYPEAAGRKHAGLPDGGPEKRWPTRSLTRLGRRVPNHRSPARQAPDHQINTPSVWAINRDQGCRPLPSQRRWRCWRQANFRKSRLKEAP